MMIHHSQKVNPAMTPVVPSMRLVYHGVGLVGCVACNWICVSSQMRNQWKNLNQRVNSLAPLHSDHLYAFLRAAKTKGILI